MKRSIGVTIFAILFIVGGAFGLLGQVLAPMAQQAVRTVLEQEEGTNLDPQTKQRLADLETILASMPYRLLATAASSARVAAGIGLLMLQGWAYWLTLGMVGISVVWLGAHAISMSAALFAGSGSVWFFWVLSMAWNGVLAWYFLRRSVKAQFARHV